MFYTHVETQLDNSFPDGQFLIEVYNALLDMIVRNTEVEWYHTWLKSYAMISLLQRDLLSQSIFAKGNGLVAVQIIHTKTILLNI